MLKVNTMECGGENLHTAPAFQTNMIGFGGVTDNLDTLSLDDVVGKYIQLVTSEGQQACCQLETSGQDDVVDPVEDEVVDPVEDEVVDPVEDDVVDPVEDDVVDPVEDEASEGSRRSKKKKSKKGRR
mgnify:CR=1 FL=1